MEFSYKGIAKGGVKVQGTKQGANEAEVIKSLKKDNILVVDIRRKQNNSASFDLKRAISEEDLVFLTSEISILLNNGVKIDKALKMLLKVKEGTPIGEVILVISQQLSKGSSLAEAFGQHPKYFSPLYVNLISIGETTGTLKQIFKELALDIKFRNQIRKKLLQALIYPSVILFVCLSAILFIFNYVVPSMAGIFESRELIPSYTRFILAMSDFLINYQFYLFVAIFLAIAAIAYLFKTDEYKRYIQAFLMKFPVIGKVYTEVERVNFTSSIKLMLSSGLKINQAIELAIGNLANEDLKVELNEAVNELKSGTSLSQSLSLSRLFPTYYQSLIEVGEETAELESVFEEIVERSRTSFESTVTQMLNLLEPLLIIIMGLIVGGVVVTLMLSITSVNDIGV